MTPVVAGIDLGGTSVKLAIADEDQRVIAATSIETNAHRGPDDVVDRIGTALEQLAQEQAATITAIGMGVPGLADIQRGVTKFLPNLTGHWREIPVSDWLSRRFDCPVRLLNDARTATLAELRFGHGRDTPQVTLAFFTLGTGVGGGVAIEGKLRLGPLGAAGELGHQTILPEGPRCGCGNRGCLETLASGTAIAAEGIRLMKMGLAPRLHALVDGVADRVSPREMAIVAESDSAVQEAIRQAATYLGIAVANTVSTLHPDLVVLGGGVSELGDQLLGPVRQVVKDRVGMFPTEGVRIERSLLGERAGLLGAVALAREVW